MTKILNSRVSRPKPSAEWSFDWRRHPRNMSADSLERVIVKAAYVADMDPLPSDGDGETLPNGFVVETGKTFGAGMSTQIRLSRPAAEQLRDALETALAWDGR